MADVHIKTVICKGEICECNCDPPVPPDPPDPSCDMSCVDVNFTGPLSDTQDIGDPIEAGVSLTRTLIPVNGLSLCDQDLILGEITVTKAFGPFFTLTWEIQDALDASTPIWTLISNTHSNGDSGSGNLTATFVWRYNAAGVAGGDITDPFEDCCIAVPEIGVTFAVPYGPYYYHLTTGKDATGSASLCGIYEA